MEASSFAAGSKLELTLLDPQQSAAGLALFTNKVLQSTISDRAAHYPVQLGDISKMVLEQPDTTHFICIPFKPAIHSDPNATCALEGTLLFGVKDGCMPTKRHLRVLILLAQLLPAALYIAASTTGILETVDFMTGATPYQCPCCLQDDECDSLDGSDDGPNSPCGEDDKRNPPGNPPSAHPLLVSPIQADELASGASEDLASSSNSFSRNSSYMLVELQNVDREEGPSGSNMARYEHTWVDDSDDHLKKAKTQFGGPNLEENFGKDDLATKISRTPSRRVVNLAAEQRHTIWANFLDPVLESEFLIWHSHQHVKVDRLFALLLLTALCIVGFCKPFRLMDYSPWGLVVGGLILGPLLCLLDRQAFIAQRERVMVVLRILLVIFVNLVSIPSYQSQMAQVQLAKAATFWMLSGAESLLIGSLGWQVRFRLQLPLQFACMAIAAWNLPSMCSSCYPEMTTGQCQGRSWRLLFGAGLVLPSALLRFMEGKSRDTFLQELAA